MFSKPLQRSQQVFKTFCNKTKNFAKRSYHNNPFKKYVEQYGDRPDFLKEAKDLKTLFTPHERQSFDYYGAIRIGVFFAFLTPLLVPLYYDYLIMEDRKNGDSA